MKSIRIYNKEGGLLIEVCQKKKNRGIVYKATILSSIVETIDVVSDTNSKITFSKAQK